MEPDFLQIGFQKCGTTFIEENVYPANPDVSCIQASKNLDLERNLLEKLIVPDGLEFDQESFINEFEEICDQLFDDKTVNGIMFEPFTFQYQRVFDRKNVIDRIHDACPDIKIITFIRNQKTWLLSHYSQYLKAGGLLSLHDFLECELNDYHLDAHYIDWYPLISYLYKIFGEEHVLVCLFEQLKKSPQSIADKIFSFLDVPKSKINPEPVNTSLSKYSLSVRRLLNHIVHYDCGTSRYSFFRDTYDAELSLFSKYRHIFIYYNFKPFTNSLCRRLDKLLKSKKKPAIEKEQLKKIVLRYAEHNRELSELLNINLAKYGYPVA